MDSSADDRDEENIFLPEEWLNIAILRTAFAYKAMNGLGTLATIWATVVLLGGFSTLVKEQDFWYVTIIAFVQSIGYVRVYITLSLLINVVVFRSLRSLNCTISKLLSPRRELRFVRQVKLFFFAEAYFNC